MINRYDFEPESYGSLCPAEDGDWVMHSDYSSDIARRDAEIAHLKADLRESEYVAGLSCLLGDKLRAMQSENDRLREALQTVDKELELSEYTEEGFLRSCVRAAIRPEPNP